MDKSPVVFDLDLYGIWPGTFQEMKGGNELWDRKFYSR